jgi:hypothetical protein
MMELLYAHSVEIGGVALLAFFALSGAATRSLRASLSAQDRAPKMLADIEIPTGKRPLSEPEFAAWSELASAFDEEHKQQGWP